MKLLVAVLLLAAVAGCSPNPLAPNLSGGGGRDTLVIITPCDTCPPPNPCPTCPPPPTDSITVYKTCGGRIHEAQSHTRLASHIVIRSGHDRGELMLGIEYEDGTSQQNENCHVYFRNVADFSGKYDMVCTLTGTEVIPDAAGVNGWLERRAVITGLPAGSYNVEIQQDLPNHHAPGESDIRFRAGTLTVRY